MNSNETIDQCLIVNYRVLGSRESGVGSRESIGRCGRWGDGEMGRWGDGEMGSQSGD
ncbi:hypothetical protein [Moorena producens]|uniref:hypothetical protein n=1 Tax=Moorena producens TaxID=1155739 RepID=UPI003C74B08C